MSAEKPPQRPERRRTPRFELASNESIRLEMRHRVQLLDISQSGVLVACDIPVPVGTRGQFRAGLGAAPFSAELAVMRQQARVQGRSTQTGLGARFASMDDRSRQHLDLFLRKGKD